MHHTEGETDMAIWYWRSLLTGRFLIDQGGYYAPEAAAQLHRSNESYWIVPGSIDSDGEPSWDNFD